MVETMHIKDMKEFMNNAMKMKKWDYSIYRNGCNGYIIIHDTSYRFHIGIDKISLHGERDLKSAFAAFYLALKYRRPIYNYGKQCSLKNCYLKARLVLDKSDTDISCSPPDCPEMSLRTDIQTTKLEVMKAIQYLQDHITKQSNSHNPVNPSDDVMQAIQDLKDHITKQQLHSSSDNPANLRDDVMQAIQDLKDHITKQQLHSNSNNPANPCDDVMQAIQDLKDHITKQYDSSEVNAKVVKTDIQTTKTDVMQAIQYLKDNVTKQHSLTVDEITDVNARVEELKYLIQQKTDGVATVTQRDKELQIQIVTLKKQLKKLRQKNKILNKLFGNEEKLTEQKKVLDGKIAHLMDELKRVQEEKKIFVIEIKKLEEEYENKIKELRQKQEESEEQIQKLRQEKTECEKFKSNIETCEIEKKVIQKELKKCDEEHQEGEKGVQGLKGDKADGDSMIFSSCPL